MLVDGPDHGREFRPLDPHPRAHVEVTGVEALASVTEAVHCGQASVSCMTAQTRSGVASMSTVMLDFTGLLGLGRPTPAGAALLAGAGTMGP